MNRFKNILYVMESTEDNQPALQRAVALAEHNQASLTVVDVIPRINAGIRMPEGGPISKDLQAALEKKHLDDLNELTAPFLKRKKITTKILVGTPFMEIIREVLRDKHDLIIKIPENQDWIDRIFGSDDMHLLRKCPCPVWLIKPQAAKAYRRILAAVDVEDIDIAEEMTARDTLNREILQLAGSLALSDFADLHIVHAWNGIAESTLRGPFIHSSDEQVNDYLHDVYEDRKNNLDALVNDVIEKLGSQTEDYLNPQQHLVKGWPREEIPVLANDIDADLVVMGTVGRTGIPGYLVGNTAEAILNQLQCSVLAIKPPGFETPVTLED